jgi:hypothetical protein
MGWDGSISKMLVFSDGENIPGGDPVYRPPDLLVQFPHGGTDPGWILPRATAELYPEKKEVRSFTFRQMHNPASTGIRIGLAEPAAFLAGNKSPAGFQAILYTFTAIGRRLLLQCFLLGQVNCVIMHTGNSASGNREADHKEYEPGKRRTGIVGISHEKTIFVVLWLG